MSLINHPLHPNATGAGGGGPAGGGGGGGGGPAINPAGPIGALLGLAGIAYGGYNSLYTVEGGHRALLFNRLVGVKEEVQVRLRVVLVCHTYITNAHPCHALPVLSVCHLSPLDQVEGMHFMLPWLEMPIIYDIRPKPRMIQSLTGSKGALRAYVCVYPFVGCSCLRPMGCCCPSSPPYDPKSPSTTKQTCRW